MEKNEDEDHISSRRNNATDLTILLMPFPSRDDDKHEVIICTTVAHVSLVFRY